MDEQEAAPGDRLLTRGAMVRSIVFGGAVVAGGSAVGGAERGISMAAPSSDTDADILDIFLLLELLQEGYYRAALESGRLSGDLQTFAQAVADQEAGHVAFLRRRLGGRARERPRSDFGPLLETPETFRDAAIELEEAAIAAYIGQGANLTRRTAGAVATLVSVEARQVAWVRDLAGVSPAPRAADPARKAEEVLRELKDRGFTL